MKKLTTISFFFRYKLTLKYFNAKNEFILKI